MERHLSTQTRILNIVKRSTLSEMVNFMCQLDWSTECLDIQSNIILGVSVGCFSMRLINI